MFGISYLRLAAYGIIALGVLSFVAWAFRVDHLRGYWHDKYDSETSQVTAQIANAIGNPKLRWRDVGNQVDAYAKGHQALLLATDEANATIDAMGAESERLKSLNAELRAKADKIIKERARLIDRLEASANDPGDVSDCQAQLAAVEAALDAVIEEGEL